MTVSQISSTTPGAPLSNAIMRPRRAGQGNVGMRGVDDPHRITASGPPLHLPARMSTYLVLAFHELLTNTGEGSVTATDVWGRRQLTYPIKKKNAGTYVIVQFSAPMVALPEFERLLKLLARRELDRFGIFNALERMPGWSIVGLAGADDLILAAISRYAIAVGQAYQLQNDLIDLHQPAHEGGDDDHRPEHVRDQVPEDDAPMTVAKRDRGLDEFLLAKRHHARADDPGHGQPLDRTDGDEHEPQRAAEQAEAPKRDERDGDVGARRAHDDGATQAPFGGIIVPTFGQAEGAAPGGNWHNPNDPTASY